MRRILRFILFLFLPMVGLIAAARPNIILIMSDDMGFSDLGCYGGEIRTPNLDQLAKEGIRFTQFYNCARCCPTRAALLTGLYPHQAGVGHMMSDQGWPAYRGDLSPHSVTIAEVLKMAGYRTYMAGKWHVTRFTSPDGPKHNWPLQRGFDRFFGTITGAGSYYDPATLTLDNTQIPPWDGFYYTDEISEFAVRCILEHDPSQPFFMYIAYTAAHWPLHAREEDIRRYRGVYDRGWDFIRQQRYRRLLELGIIRPEWNLSPRDPHVPSWDMVPDGEKAWHIRCMEVYAAQVECMDRGIGRIIEALKKTDQYENTIIFFLQDNGGCAEAIGRGRPRKIPENSKPLGSEELQQQLVPFWTRDGKPVRQGKGVMPGPADTYLSYGRPWANVSNTPFREYKHWVHEGGIASPLIVHWPAGIRPELRGTLTDQIAHVIDLMPTCVELAGATYPNRYKGREIKPPAGISLVPVFSGTSIERNEPLFWEHEGNRAVRFGKWKLVSKHKRPWELYDMSQDRSELHDLSSKHPEIVQKLEGLYETWAKQSGVRPWPVRPPKQTPPAQQATASPQSVEAQNQAHKAPRPNILLAIADDWGWPNAGAYGDPAAHTPTFDLLAREGVLFQNAFVTAPSCTPSRGSILTGQWHWRLEENVNLWSTLRAEYKTYPDLLRKAGYFVGHCNKGWGPGRLEPGGRTENPAGPRFRNLAEFLKRRPPGTPFCFWLGSYDPHRPYEWKSGIRAGIDPAKIRVPPYLPDHPVVRTDLADYYAEVERFDRLVGEAIELLRQAGELEHTIIVITGDNGMPFPRAKSNLYDAGTHVPLLIWFPKRFPGGRVVLDFVSLQDLAPTFLEVAGIPVPKEMTGRSLLPILESRRDGWIDPHRDFVITGKERHVPAQEPGNPGGYPCRAIRTRDYLYIRNFKPERWPAGTPGISHYGRQFADCDDGPTKQFMIKHRFDPYYRHFFFLAFEKRPAEELYDLRNDPFQLLNVASRPAYAKVKNELASKLMEILRKTGDLRVLGGAEKWESYPYYGGPRQYWKLQDRQTSIGGR